MLPTRTPTDSLVGNNDEDASAISTCLALCLRQSTCIGSVLQQRAAETKLRSTVKCDSVTEAEVMRLCVYNSPRRWFRLMCGDNCLLCARLLHIPGGSAHAKGDEI